MRDTEYDHPYLNLASELIKTTLKDIVLDCPDNREKYYAEQWLTNDANHDVISFIWCCNVLNVNFKQTREELLRRIKSGTPIQDSDSC